MDEEEELSQLYGKPSMTQTQFTQSQMLQEELDVQEAQYRLEEEYLHQSQSFLDAEHDEEQESDVEEEFEDVSEQDAEDNDEIEFKDDFKSRERVSFQREIPQTESEMFLYNIEEYSRVHKLRSTPYNDYSVLLQQYPHPRCLHPGASIATSYFLEKSRKSYVWDKTVFDRIKDQYKTLTPTIMYRYIKLFNYYAFPITD
jgi:hypothetical protein